LAVVDLAGGAGVLPGHAGRPGALLDEPGLIDDEHPAGAQPLEHVAAQLVADRVGIPVRGAQQPLHAIG
jgi:hypothetical protein